MYALENGVKNLAVVKKDEIETISFPSGMTVTINDDASITIKITTALPNNFAFSYSKPFKTILGETYTLSGCSSTGPIRIIFRKNGNNFTAEQYNSTPVDWTADSDYSNSDLIIYCYSGTSNTTLTLYPMLSPKTAYQYSNDYVNGALSNSDLTLLEAEDRTMLNGIVLNSAKTSGSLNDETNQFTLCSPDVTNKPVADIWGYCKTAKYNNDLIQEFTTVQATTKTFRRVYSGGNWTHWTPLGMGYTVYSSNSSTLIDHTYAMNKKDFMLPTTSASSSGDSSGIYLIYMISWAVSPTISVYAVGYTGGDFSYTKNAVQKITGTDVNVTVSNQGLITVPYAGKVQIIALT